MANYYCPNYTVFPNVEEDPVLLFTTYQQNQLMSSFDHFRDDYHSWNWTNEFLYSSPIMESSITKTTIDPGLDCYYDLSIVPSTNTTTVQDNNQSGNTLKAYLSNYEKKDSMLRENENAAGCKKSDNAKVLIDKRKVDDDLADTKMLTREVISRYFYMPITQAAKELNIGLTLFKKRCRELGIPRWPHRKLASLQNLIKNVQVLGREGGDVSEEEIQSAIQGLEHERKLMEQMPNKKFEDRTKRLRQACFKANYKKRKLIEMESTGYNVYSSSGKVVNPSTDLSSVVECASVNNYGVVIEDDDDELKSLLSDSDCFSSNQSLLF